MLRAIGQTVVRLFALSVLGLVPTVAQITNVTDDVATPIPGVGHDYIHMLSETVSPANGAVSLRIQLPVPKGRGITIPFAFAYDSGGVHHLVQSLPGGVGANWQSNTNSFASGGWSYSYPSLSANQWQTQVCVVTGYNGSQPICTYYPCEYQSSYTFRDAGGNTHALYLGALWSANWPPSGCSGLAVSGGGDRQYNASIPYNPGSSNTPSSVSPLPATIYDDSGTVYYFTSLPGSGPSNSQTISGVPTYIEDRNGNKVTATQNGNTSFSFTDTLGRTVISANGFGPSGSTNTVSVGGLTYSVTWKTVSASFSIPSVNIPVTNSSCVWPANVSDSQTVISQITLPNGQAYKFYYGDNPDPNYQNPYGLLSEIDYPTGGWVKYTWKLSDQMNEFMVYPGTTNGSPPPGTPYPDGCLYQYKTPVVATRSVGFGGSSTAALVQSFTYSTAWSTSPSSNGLNPAGSFWAGTAGKSTTVVTTDNVIGQNASTTYNYSPVYLPNDPFNTSNFQAQVPVESSIQYQDWGSSTVLRTVTKNWADQFTLLSETTTDNGQTSKTVNCYAGTNCLPPAFPAFLQLIERDDYDFPSGSTLIRKTLTTYQSFSGTPGVIGDRPCKVVVQNGSGTSYAETDYFYDNGTSVCGSPGAPSVASVSGLSTTTHDETLFASASSTSRGNVTKLTKKCLQSCSDATTTYTYDETGQVRSKTDPCGNSACSDMTGSSHITNYSYTDTYSSCTGAAPPIATSNAYLTSVTDPLGHTQTYCYGYDDGQLRGSTDPNSLTTLYTYNSPPSGCSQPDGFDRLSSASYPDGGSTTYCYNDTPPSPSVTTTKKINGSRSVTTVSVEDGIGHVKQNQLSDTLQGTIYTDTTYDGSGRVYSVSNPYRSGTDPTSTPGTTIYGYDGIGRKTSETYPDNSVLKTAYCGASTLVTDPTGRWRRSRVDGVGHLVEVDEPNAVGASVAASGCPGTGEPIWITSYTLDPLGNLTNVVQNGSHQRSFNYDSLSRLLTSSNPEVGTLQYSYDANGNLSTKKDARSVTTTYGYDVVNRGLSRTYSDGTTPSVTIAYDQTNCLSLPSCQNIGHRTSMTDGAGSELWAYQVDKPNLRNVHTDQRTIASGSNNITKTTTYYVDLLNNPFQIAYPAPGTGQVVNYTYDSANRPSTASDGSNGITYASGFETPPSGCPANAVCYTPEGTFYALSIGQTSAFTGLNLTHKYNNRLQPLEFQASSSGGSAMDISYSFQDPLNNNKNAGHVFQISNNLNSSRTQSFTYDQVNRITSAGTSATTGSYCWGYQYTYDPWANLTSQVGWTPTYNACTEVSMPSVAVDSNNHLPSPVSYDPSGNTTSDGLWSYSWDAESQLKSGAGINYSYDGDGRRVAKVGSKLYWYGMDGEILAETDSSGNAINQYVYFAGRRIALLSSSTH